MVLQKYTDRHRDQIGRSFASLGEKFGSKLYVLLYVLYNKTSPGEVSQMRETTSPKSPPCLVLAGMPTLFTN